ncbi:MAG: hypothetical protein NC321_08450 [Clostridium sp.]|nr:hypothetical protein [Clostridium sp.]
MKISEAQSIYRAYRQDLINQTKTLIKQRDEAQKKFETTGSSQFSEQAATLQLSIEATQEKFDENQKVLDSLTEQYAAVWNAEVSKQQADVMQDMGIELSKIMTVARRMSNGDEVPYTDEKKLLEYSDELYQAAKSAQMIHQMEEHEKYDSLWGEEEEPEEYDPQGKAENAEVQIALPDIPTQVFTDDSVEASETTI